MFERRTLRQLSDVPRSIGGGAVQDTPTEIAESHDLAFRPKAQIHAHEALRSLSDQ